MNELALHWPAWLGTPSQAALVVIVIVALIKAWPVIQAKALEAKLVREGRYGERIRHLETELVKCHDECNQKIDKQNDKINGMVAQRAAEQIAVMRAILRTVEDPGLRKQLELLESMHVTIPPTFVGGPLKDGDNNE